MKLFLNLIPSFNENSPISVCETTILGVGSHGVVFAASLDGKQLAIKFLEVKDADEELDFKREIALQKYCKAYASEIWDSGIIQNTQIGFVAMERSQMTLDVFLSSRRSSNHIKEVLQQIGYILEFLSKNGCTHGDLAPFNVSVQNIDPLKLGLLDFGLASFSLHVPHLDITRIHSEVYLNNNPLSRTLNRSNANMLLEGFGSVYQYLDLPVVQNSDSNAHWESHFDDYMEKMAVI